MAAKSAPAKVYTEVTIGNLSDEVKRAVDSICRRAYEIAAERAFAAGHDLDDWLTAEHELFFVPASELTETEAEYTLKVAVTGFEPGQVAVSAEPQWVTAWAKAEAGHENVGDANAECPTAAKEMFCRYRLPHPIVVDNAEAFCDSRELTVILPKRCEPREADSERPAAA